MLVTKKYQHSCIDKKTEEKVCCCSLLKFSALWRNNDLLEEAEFSFQLLFGGQLFQLLLFLHLQPLPQALLQETNSLTPCLMQATVYNNPGKLCLIYIYNLETEIGKTFREQLKNNKAWS